MRAYLKSIGWTIPTQKIIRRLLPLFLGVSIFSPLFSSGDPVLDGILEQIRINEQRRAAGKSKGNYLLDFSISSLKPEEGEWVVEKGHSADFQPALPHRETLNGLLIPFNEQFEGNLKKVQIYAVYIRFPDLAIRSDIPQAVKGSDKILNFLKNSSPGDYSAYQDYLNNLSRQIHENLNSEVFTQLERAIVLVGEYQYRNRDQWKKRITWSFRTKGVFIHTVESDLDAFVQSKLDTRDDYPAGMNAGARYIHDFIYAALEFFGDPDHLSGDESCAELNAGLSRQVARDYIDLWCEAMQVDPEIKKYVFAVAQYLDQLGPWIEEMDVGNLDNLTNLTVQHYLNLYQDNIGMFLGWKEYLASRIDESASIAELGLWIRWASEDDYRNLSLARKKKLLGLYNAYWSEGFPLYIAGLNSVQILGPEWMPYTHLFVPQRTLQGALDGNTPGEIRELLDFLAGTPGMVKRLYEVADNLFSGSDQEEGLVKVITGLALKAEGMQGETPDLARFGARFNGKTFIWKVPPWYRQLTNGYYHFEKQIGFTGGVAIEQNLCIRTFCYPADWKQEPRETESCLCAEYETSSFDFSPFELVALTFAENASFLNICATDPLEGCTNRTLLLPAFTFAWIIEKKADEDLFNSGMAALDAAGFAVGIGELNLAIRGGSAARKLLAGWTLFSESASLTLTSDVFRDHLIETYGEKGLIYYNNLQVINLLNMAGTNAFGMLDLGDAIRFTGTESALRQVQEEAPEMLVVASADVERALDAQEEAVLEFMGFSEGMRKYNRDFALQGTNYELYNQLLANIPVIQLFNDKPQLVEVWKAIRNSQAYKFYLELDDVGFSKFWKDLYDYPEIAGIIKTKPDLLGAWQILEDGPYRIDPGALQLFDQPNQLLARQRVLAYDIDNLYPNILVEELAAVRHYTLFAYKDLNTGLRNGTNNIISRALERLINNCLSKLPNYTGETYRGTTLPILVVLEKYKPAFENGGTVIEKSFTSTSKNIAIAQEFQNANPEDLWPVLDPAFPDKEVKTLFYINGHKGKEIEMVSHFGENGPGREEYEVLFKSNSVFRVTNVEANSLDNQGNVIVKIYLEEQ